MTPVGIVGLGKLGHALAARLIDAGYTVVGHDIARARVDALEAIGGKAAASAQEAAESAETICVVLPSAAAVEEAIFGSSGIVMRAKAGAAILQMSTMAPARTERLAREVTTQGLTYLDCPVSGTSDMVARGEGVIMCGGDHAVFERERPVLDAMLPAVVYVGAAGQASLMALVAKMLVAVHTAAAAEALSLARRAGFDLDVLLTVLGAGAGASRMLEARGPMMARDEFPPGTTLALFMKELELVRDAARALGAPLLLTDVARNLYATALETGHGDDDLAVVIKSLEP